MTHEEILRGVIEKAMKHGFVPPIGHITITYDVTPQYGPHIRKKSKLGLEWPEIIFSHKFAKAFWGEKKVCEECGLGNKWFEGITYLECCSGWTWTKGIPSWQYHLQQMVLEDDPITYLQRFL